MLFLVLHVLFQATFVVVLSIELGDSKCSTPKSHGSTIFNRPTVIFLLMTRKMTVPTSGSLL